MIVKDKEQKFVNGIGFGIDGYCCEEGDRLSAASTKPVNYSSIAIKGMLYGFKPVNAVVTVDGVKHEYTKVWLAPTMHGKYYGGGMKIAPKQDRLASDKTLSLVVLHGVSNLKALSVFPKIIKGEHENLNGIVDIFTGKEITVEFDRPTPLQIDGGTVKDVTTYTARVSR